MQKVLKLRRMPLPVAAGALFAAFALTPSPSVPSVPDGTLSSSQLTQAEELQALAGWLSGRSDEAGELRALRPADLAGALRPNQRRFELFRHESADRARRRILEEMPFGQALADAADRNRVDGLLLAAVVEAESRFAPAAVSPRGAVGLMQLMPATAAMYDAGDLRDPHVNLEAGSRYLGSLIELYDGDLELALAAYNAGPAAVERYGGVPPFAETRAYVRKVLARYLEHTESVEAAVEPQLLPARSEASRTLLASEQTAPARRPVPGLSPH